MYASYVVDINIFNITSLYMLWYVEIGDVNTPIEEVNRFYEYWTNFESWRDFTGIGAEHNPDEAQDRYQKRMYQQENEKLAKKLKKKEIERIINLVTRAMQFDPRIIADKEKKKLAKEAKLREKEEEKRLAELAAQQQLEAEAAAKENQKNAKFDKEKQRKLESKVRNTCKKLLRIFATRCNTIANNTSKNIGEYGMFSIDDIENVMLTQSTMDDLNNINDILGGEAVVKDEGYIHSLSDEECNSIRTLIKEQVNTCKNRMKAAATPNNAAAVASAAVSTTTAGIERQWNRDELSALAKAIKKFPAGAANRWVSIAQELNTVLKPEAGAYTVDECLRISHNIVKMMSNLK